MLQRFDVRCQVLPLKHDILFKLRLLSGEMQSVILSLLLRVGGGVSEKKRGIGADNRRKKERRGRV